MSPWRCWPLPAALGSSCAASGRPSCTSPALAPARTVAVDASASPAADLDAAPTPHGTAASALVFVPPHRVGGVGGSARSAWLRLSPVRAIDSCRRRDPCSDGPSQPLVRHAAKPLPCCRGGAGRSGGVSPKRSLPFVPPHHASRSVCLCLTSIVGGAARRML